MSKKPILGGGQARFGDASRYLSIASVPPSFEQDGGGAGEVWLVGKSGTWPHADPGAFVSSRRASRETVGREPVFFCFIFGFHTGREESLGQIQKVEVWRGCDAALRSASGSPCVDPRRREALTPVEGDGEAMNFAHNPAPFFVRGAL